MLRGPWWCGRARTAGPISGLAGYRRSRGRGDSCVTPEEGRGASDEPRRILAMGGGGFTMDERTPALDRFVLELTGKPAPKVCFLPTASGDPREQVTRFYERFGDWPCEPSILSLFHLGRDRIDPVEHLLAQDAIYVGGGSMRNMLAIWREHAIDDAMREAWSSGGGAGGPQRRRDVLVRGRDQREWRQARDGGGTRAAARQPVGAPRQR